MEITENREIKTLFVQYESSGHDVKILTAEFIDQLLSSKLLLGSGATSTVYRVKNLLTNKGFLCLKVLKSEAFRRLNQPQPQESEERNIWNEEEEEEAGTHQNEDSESQINFDIVYKLYSEYEILNNLKNPNIVKVYGFFLGDQTRNPAILLEYCKFNLENVIRNLNDIDLIGIIYEICYAMKYVHEKNIIHRDLKMKNILINLKKHVKICDFGISKVVDLTTLTSLTSGVGTFAFMAPEIFQQHSRYTVKVDVYAFGVVMYYILTKGQFPEYTGIGSYANLNLPSSINKLSKSIIKKCWSLSPDERPSFSNILDMIVENNFMLINGIEENIPYLKTHLGLA